MVKQHFEFFMFKQQSGAMLSDSVDIWTLGLDMLPSSENELELYIKNVSTGAGNEKVCDKDTGTWVDSHCEIQAKFVDLGSANPETSTYKQNINKVIKLERTLMDGSNFVLKGRPINGETGSRLEIYFLHGWDAEDGIMGEVILKVILRRIYMNVYSYHEYKQDGTPTEGEVHKSSNIEMEEKFILSIKAIADKGGNGYNITFDCNEPYFHNHTMRLPFTSVDHIFINVHNVEVVHAEVDDSQPTQIKPPKFASISESRPFDFTEKLLKSGQYLIISAKLLKSPHPQSFTINFVHFDAESAKNSKILMRFKFNYESGSFSFEANPGPKLNQTTLPNANLSKPLKAGNDFSWIFMPENAIFLDHQHLFDADVSIELEKLNYLQGNLAHVEVRLPSNELNGTFARLTNLTMRGIPIFKEGKEVILLKFMDKHEENLFSIEFSKQILRIQSKIGDVEFPSKGVELKQGIPFVFLLYASVKSYIVFVKNTPIGQIPFNDILPSPEEIHLVESGISNIVWTQQPHQIDSKPHVYTPDKYPMISKSLFLQEKLTNEKWISVTVKLMKPFESLTLNFMESPDDSKILMQFEYKDKKFTLKFNQTNANYTDKEELLKSDDFDFVYIPDNGFFVNHQHVFDDNETIQWDNVDCIQFKSNFTSFVGGVHEIPITSKLSAPFHTLTDLKIEGNLYFKQFEKLHFAFKCSSQNHCYQKSKNPMILGSNKEEESSFDIEITRENVFIKSKFGQTNFTLKGKGVQFQTKVPFKMTLRAGLANYDLVMDGKTIGQIPYYGILPSPNHIDTVESMETNFIFTQQLQIVWNQELIKLPFSFSYKLDMPLQIGSALEFTILNKFPYKKQIILGIHLLHQAPFQAVTKPEFGTIILLMVFDFGNNIFSIGKGPIEVDLKSGKIACKFTILENRHYKIHINGKEVMESEQELSYWAVQFISFKSSETFSKDQVSANVKVSWPSDNSQNWLIPDISFSLLPANSFPVNLISFQEIEISGMMKENLKEFDIYFLNNCAEWVKEICDAILHIHIDNKNGESEFGVKSWSYKKQEWFLQENATMKMDTLMKFALKIFPENKKTRIQFNAIVSNFTTLNLQSANYVWITGDITQIESPKIKYFDKPQMPYSYRMDRPLNVGNSIEIKGKIAEDANDFEIALLHGVAEDDPVNKELNGTIIMKMKFSSPLSSFSYYLSHGYGPIGNEFKTKEERVRLDFHKPYLRIDVKENKFTITEVNNNKQIGEFEYGQKEGNYPYWAVQFIQVFGLNE